MVITHLFKRVKIKIYIYILLMMTQIIWNVFHKIDTYNFFLIFLCTNHKIISKICNFFISFSWMSFVTFCHIFYHHFLYRFVCALIWLLIKDFDIWNNLFVLGYGTGCGVVWWQMEKWNQKAHWKFVIILNFKCSLCERMRFHFYHDLQLLNINLNTFLQHNESSFYRWKKNIIDRCNKAKLLSRKMVFLLQTSFGCIFYF